MIELKLTPHEVSVLADALEQATAMALDEAIDRKNQGGGDLFGQAWDMAREFSELRADILLRREVFYEMMREQA